MSWFLERMLIDGEQLDARIESNIEAGSHVRSMKSTSNVELTVHDPERVLLSTGTLTRRVKKKPHKIRQTSQLRIGEVRLTLDGDPYLLSSYRKEDSVLHLIFEHEITVLMRRYTKKVVAARSNYTRSEFISFRLVNAVKERSIARRFIGIEQRQPQKKPEIETRKIERGAHLEIKGVPIDKEQRRNIVAVLEVIEETNAGENAALALIEACIQESLFRNPMGGDSTSSGILQILSVSMGGSTSTRGGRRDVKLVAKNFLLGQGEPYSGRKGAIQLAIDHPKWTPGEIAQALQISGFPDRYEVHRTEAERILEFGGGAGATLEIRERYLFHAGTLDGFKENYWDAASRLAQEVNWSFFVANNILFYAKDTDLIRAAPVAMIAEFPSKKLDRVGVQYVGNIDFEQADGKRVDELTFTAHANQFFAYPGATIDVVDPYLKPAQGKYLIEEIRDTLGSAEVEITCRRPARPAKEPASTVTSRPAEDREDVGNLRNRIVQAAKDSLSTKTGYNYYLKGGSTTTDPTPARGLRSDCSQWIYAIYTKAGAPSSPGLNTWEQARIGRRTARPRPGDLMLSGPVDHVELFVGELTDSPGFNTIGHGSELIDPGKTDWWPGHFFVTYDFLDE